MKHAALAFIVLTIMVFPSSAMAEGETALRARTAVKELHRSLKGQLLKAINEKGYEGAIESCAIHAITVPAEQSRRGKVTSIKRVSLKYRNPANAPDAWETGQLMAMEEDFGRGALKSMYQKTFYSEDGKRTYRHMEPIKVSALCLSCHGTPDTMHPGAAAKIKKLYPADNATGYAEGDLRGAVSVTIQVDQ